MKTCQYCHKELTRKSWVGKRKYLETNKRFNERKFCDNICRSSQLAIDSAGEKNYFYGRHLRPHNYKENIRWVVKPSNSYNRVIYRDKDGNKYYKYEHREVVEIYTEKILTKQDVVHHIDGNKHNNRIENLLVCTPQQHRKLHQK